MSVMSLSWTGLLLLLTSRVGVRLLSSTSELSALLFLVSLGEETEDVLRLLLAGAYLCIERRLFLSRLMLRLLLLDGLRRRLRGGVKLRSRLLLRVSRRSSRSRPLRALAVPLIRSLEGETLSRALRLAALFREPWDDMERDRDREEEFRRLRCRDLGGGDGLKDFEGDLLRFLVGGDLDLDMSEGVYDLRRCPRSELRPLPPLPLPR
jgi:hypothetical protein